MVLVTAITDALRGKFDKSAASPKKSPAYRRASSRERLATGTADTEADAEAAMPLLLIVLLVVSADVDKDNDCSDGEEDEGFPITSCTTTTSPDLTMKKLRPGSPC